MNPIQLEQLMPKVQQQESVKELKTGDSSFAEALKNAREANRDEENSHSNENVAKNNDSNGKTQENIEVAREDHKEQVSEKTVKKSEEMKSDSEIAETAAENAAFVLANNIPVDENVPANIYKLAASSENNLTDKITKTQDAPSEDLSVSEKMMSWLTVKNVDDVSENSLPKQDDFAALIEAAVEFIPGNESEFQKLESAQNLSISDPELFLQKVHELADFSTEGLAQNQKEILESEIKNTKEKKSDVKLSVHDLRTHRLASENIADSQNIVSKVAEKKEGKLVLEVQQKNENTMQISMELADKIQQNITSSSGQTAAASGSNFQQMLSHAVAENAPDFVKAGNVILKDNNSGIINLIVKPESLGNVKISLNINDKVISGQIQVQSKEAFEAFRESISSLKAAFAESGFETGSFDLSFSNQQNFAQSGGNGQDQNQNPNAAFLADRAYGSYSVSENEAPDPNRKYESGSNYSVNIVA